MPTVSITVYSARGGCLVRVKDGVMFNPSIRVEGEHREEVDVSDLDNMLKQYAAFLDRCVESGEYAINPECIKNPLPRPVSQQPATLPENSEQDETRELEEAINIANTGAGIRTWALMELFIPSITKDKAQGLRALNAACDACQIIPDMSDEDIIARLEVYIDVLKEVAPKWQGTIEERNAEVERRVRAFFSGDLENGFPKEQPEPQRENLPDSEDSREYCRDYVGLALFKATSKNGKEYSYWKPYYVDPEDPNAVKAQGRIVTFGDHADTIRWLVPEEERPEDEKMVRLSQPIRGYYTLGKQADGRKFTEWTKFERAD